MKQRGLSSSFREELYAELRASRPRLFWRLAAKYLRLSTVTDEEILSSDAKENRIAKDDLTVSDFTGGDGAPDLTESLRNLAINGAAVGILGYIFQRDLKRQQSDKKVIEREEALACLQVYRLGDVHITNVTSLASECWQLPSTDLPDFFWKKIYHDLTRVAIIQICCQGIAKDCAFNTSMLSMGAQGLGAFCR